MLPHILNQFTVLSLILFQVTDPFTELCIILPRFMQPLTTRLPFIRLIMPFMVLPIILHPSMALFILTMELLTIPYQRMVHHIILLISFMVPLTILFQYMELLTILSQFMDPHIIQFQSMVLPTIPILSRIMLRLNTQALCILMELPYTVHLITPNLLYLFMVRQGLTLYMLLLPIMEFITAQLLSTIPLLLTIPYRLPHSSPLPTLA